MTPGPAPTSGGPVRPAVAVAFAAIGFLALAIAGLGVTSLVLDADVIGVEGLGQIPGIAAMIAAVLVFAGVLAFGVRAQHPSYWIALIVALATALAYAAGVVIGAVATGADLAAAVAAGGGVFVGWFGIVIAAAALVSAWGGVALVRTRARRPRWHWERDDDAE